MNGPGSPAHSGQASEVDSARLDALLASLHIGNIPPAAHAYPLASDSEQEEDEATSCAWRQPTYSNPSSNESGDLDGPSSSQELSRTPPGSLEVVDLVASSTEGESDSESDDASGWVVGTARKRRVFAFFL